MRLLLYFSPGSCSRVPLILLEEIGVPFDTHLIVFMRGEHKTPEYLALNPAGKVPTLVANGAAISQNPAIQLFLARSFPDARLLPIGTDPLADAKIESQLAWFSADLHPLVTRIRIPQFISDATPERVKDIALAAMAQQLGPLEQKLADRSWVLGDTWSSLDAYLFWVWFRITGAGFDPLPFPNIATHHARMNERPAVQRALAREAEAQADLERRGLAFAFTPPGARQ